MATRHPLVLNGGQIEQLQDGDSVPAADKLAAARTISLSGDAAGSASFDGSGNVSIATTVADDSHNHVIGNVDGLQSALDGKAASSHTHSYAPVAHTHGGGDITSAVANATSAASCSGNAATATKLATARTISLTGDVTGSASFDGSANAAIAATVANDSHTHIGGNITSAVANATTAASCSGNAATATKLSSITTTFTGTYPLTVNVNGVIYSHTGITYSGSGDILTAGTFSGALSGNAATATKLATARTISLTGDVTGSASFDGSANASITATVADDSHNHTIANVDSLQTTLDGKVPTGRTVTAGNGMTGGGALSANITLTMGTPGSCSTSTTNSVTSTSHTHAITGVAASSHTHSYAPIPTSSALPVGTVCVCMNYSSSSIANGSTIAGSSLRPIATPSDTAAGGPWPGAALAGTWKNIHGAIVYETSNSFGRACGLFVRTA